jgi:hypothetical protein
MILGELPALGVKIYVLYGYGSESQLAGLHHVKVLLLYRHSLLCR